MEVKSKRASKSKPDRGILYLAWEVKNQTGETVLTLTGIHLRASESPRVDALQHRS